MGGDRGSLRGSEGFASPDDSADRADGAFVAGYCSWPEEIRWCLWSSGYGSFGVGRLDRWRGEEGGTYPFPAACGSRFHCVRVIHYAKNSDKIVEDSNWE